MLDKFMKAAKVKSEEDFLAKYPSEEAFFKAFPKFKNGGNIPKAKGGMKVTSERWDPQSQMWVLDEGMPERKVKAPAVPQFNMAENPYGGVFNQNQSDNTFYSPYKEVNYDGIITPNYMRTTFNPQTNKWDKTNQVDKVELQAQYAGDWNNSQRQAFEAQQPSSFGPYNTTRGKRRSRYNTEYDDMYEKGGEIPVYDPGGPIYTPQGQTELISPQWSGQKPTQIDPWKMYNPNSQETMDQIYQTPQNISQAPSQTSGSPDMSGVGQVVDKVTGVMDNISAGLQNFTKGTIMAGNALAMNVLGNTQRDDRLDREYQKPNYNQFAYGTGSQAIAKHGMSIPNEGTIDNLSVIKGGHAKVISDNPYTSETVQYYGQSHDNADNGGITIDYNGKPVKVEGGETQTANVVFGNMKIPGTSTKFKNAVKQVAKEETKASKIMAKGEELLAIEPINAYRALKVNSGKLLTEISDAKLKEAAKTKEQLSLIQDMMLKGKEQNKMKDGGKVNPALFTRDKSKVQAYNDSLNSYNLSIPYKDKIKGIYNTATDTRESTSKILQVNQDFKDKGMKFSLGFNRQELPYRNVSDGKLGAILYDFKKPVQPYQLEKPQKQINYLTPNGMQQLPSQGTFSNPELLYGDQMVPYRETTTSYPGGPINWEEKGMRMENRVYKDGGLIPIAKDGKTVSPDWTSDYVSSSVRQAAMEVGIDPNIYERLAYIESGFRPGAKGPKTSTGTAYGHVQFLPETAKEYGLTENQLKSKDKKDIDAVSLAGAKHLKKLVDKYDGDYDYALMAYNAGEGSKKSGKGLVGIKKMVSSFLGKPEEELTGREVALGLQQMQEDKPTKDKTRWKYQTNHYVNNIMTATDKAFYGDGYGLGKKFNDDVYQGKDVSRINQNTGEMEFNEVVVKPTIETKQVRDKNDFGNWYTQQMQPNVYNQDKQEGPFKGPTNFDFLQSIGNPTISPEQPVKKLPSLADTNNLKFAEIVPEIGSLLSNIQGADFVQGQQYDPTLYTPYQVSFQDRLNENNAQLKAMERMAVNNPSAMATLAAQNYQANNSVLGEQFRTNQGITNDVINKNVSLINDAEMKNIGLRDQQYARQAQAEANTRQQIYDAMSSISNKYSKNKKENIDIRLKETIFPNYKPSEDGKYEMEFNGQMWKFDPYSNSMTPMTAKSKKEVVKDGDTTTTTEYKQANAKANKKWGGWI